MRFSTNCWSEHILSAYKATKDLKHPLYMTFKSIPALRKKIRLSISFLVSTNIYSSAERSARNMSSVALTTTAHEQTQYNRVWYNHFVYDFLALKTYSNRN